MTYRPVSGHFCRNTEAYFEPKLNVARAPAGAAFDCVGRTSAAHDSWAALVRPEPEMVGPSSYCIHTAQPVTGDNAVEELCHNVPCRTATPHRLAQLIVSFSPPFSLRLLRPAPPSRFPRFPRLRVPSVSFPFCFLFIGFPWIPT